MGVIMNKQLALRQLGMNPDGLGVMGGGAAAVAYSISGKVTNNTTNISGATIALGAYTATSGVDGTYTITGLPAGSNGSMTCTKAGYTFTAISVSAMTGNLTAQNYNDPYVIFDQFTAADGTNLSGKAPSHTTNGVTWTQIHGTADIQSNREHGITSSGTYGETMHVVESGLGDCEIDVVLNGGNVAGAMSVGIVFRYINATNWLACQITAAKVAIFKVEGDAYSELMKKDQAFSKSADHTLKITLDGAHLTALVDGVHSITVDSAFNQTATKHGVRIQAAHYADDFAIFPLTGA
jgi:hypothetical protein